MTIIGTSGKKDGHFYDTCNKKRSSLLRQLLDISGGPKGSRTPVFGVRGRRPRPLDDGTVTSDIQFRKLCTQCNQTPCTSQAQKLAQLKRSSQCAVRYLIHLMDITVFSWYPCSLLLTDRITAQRSREDNSVKAIVY